MSCTHMVWTQRYADAWTYGHNVVRLKSPEVSRFAHAFADVTEDHALDLFTFADEWQRREFEPDRLGTYHHIGPWVAVPDLS